MSQNAVPRYFGLEPNQGAEIGRFILKSDVDFNDETEFLAHIPKLMREARSEIRGLISYAGPVERTDAFRAICKRIMLGRSTPPRTLRWLADRARARWSWRRTGLSSRSAYWQRSATRSAASNIRCVGFLEAGAPTREPHEELRDWVLHRALQDRKHPRKAAGLSRARVAASGYDGFWFRRPQRLRAFG